MLEWEHVPERLGPQASGWAAQENENDIRQCPERLGPQASGWAAQENENDIRQCPERLGPQASGWAAQENENDIRQCPERLGRSICCSLCSVSNFLSHTTFQIKWEVYFFKEVFARIYYCVSLWFCMYMHMSIKHMESWMFVSKSFASFSIVFMQRQKVFIAFSFWLKRGWSFVLKMQSWARLTGRHFILVYTTGGLIFEIYDEEVVHEPECIGSLLMMFWRHPGWVSVLHDGLY